MNSYILLLIVMFLASSAPPTMGSDKQNNLSSHLLHNSFEALPQEMLYKTLLHSDSRTITKFSATCKQHLPAASFLSSQHLSGFILNVMGSHKFDEVVQAITCIKDLFLVNQKHHLESPPLKFPECSASFEATTQCSINLLKLAAEHPDLVNPLMFSISQKEFIYCAYRVPTSRSLTNRNLNKFITKVSLMQRGRFKVPLKFDSTWDLKVLRWLSKSKILRMFQPSPEAISTLYCLDAHDAFKNLTPNTSNDALIEMLHKPWFGPMQDLSPLVISPNYPAHHDTSEHPPFKFRQDESFCISGQPSFASIVAELATISNVLHPHLFPIYYDYMVRVNGIGIQELLWALSFEPFHNGNDTPRWLIWNWEVNYVLKSTRRARKATQKVFASKPMGWLMGELEKQGLHDTARMVIQTLSENSIVPEGYRAEDYQL